MEVPLIGVAFPGTVFGELLRAVVEPKEKAKYFKPQLEQLESTLRHNTKVIEQIEKYNEILDHPRTETQLLKEKMQEGVLLVRKCSTVKWNPIKKTRYADRLVKLNSLIDRFFQVDMQAQQTRDTKEILLGMRDLQRSFIACCSNGDISGKFNQDGIIRPCSVPDPPEITPGLDVSHADPLAYFDYTAFGADNSPFQSPPSISPCRNPVSPTGTSSPMNSKLSRETASHVEVHPLPLPPGSPISSPSTSIPHISAKPEPLPMNNQWKKGKLIGRGTFGSVYVASNRETGALCAVKEVKIFPDDPKSAECIKQLEQEIKVLSHLKHPNIVQYYGSEIAEDKFYIYLEYVHPGSINKYICEHCGAMTESVVRNFTRHILSGLAYLHGKKTIHRDIKGANLLVDALGVVKLADFGMAKLLTGQGADLSLKGSPYWMAPELILSVMQKDSNSDLALAVDIWSLGCTIIEMFTGKPPWSEFEGAAAMFKAMNNTPTIPENLSAEGKDFLQCCFRRHPAERPTASKLLEHQFLKNSQHTDIASCSHSFTVG